MAAAVIARRRGWSLVSISNQVREMSELIKQNMNGRRAFLVDTLSLVRRLEGQGVPSNYAEAITLATTEVLNDCLENVSQCFVSNEKMRMEHHLSSLQRETEKLGVNIEKMRSEFGVKIDKMRSELGAEIEKMRSEHRADNKLMRSELGADIEKMRSELGVNIGKMQSELRADIHSLKSQLEAGKYDVIKYCVGTLVSIVAVGFAGIKILM